MRLGDEIPIMGASWAFIHFVENPGMAFGLNFGGDTGKIILTLFRLVVVVVFLFMLRSLIVKKNTPIVLLVSFALIIAGAMGNILDSLFYGLFFSNSSYHGGVAELVSMGEGYAPMLQGKVVDMFYFPMYRGELPSWVPIWGGEYFEFFRPVFNVADTAISTGIGLFLLNHKKQEQITSKEAFEIEVVDEAIIRDEEE